MCEYCGCRSVPAITELMDEHADLREQSSAIRRALAEGDAAGARDRLVRLIGHLGVHVAREEKGVFLALRQAAEFLTEVGDLEGEHRDLEASIAALDPRGSGFSASATDLLARLDEHIEREELGIFPVAVVTLGARGWRTVERAYDALPTFLSGRVGLT